MLSKSDCLLLHIYVSLNVGQDLLQCLLSDLQRTFQTVFLLAIMDLAGVHLHEKRNSYVQWNWNAFILRCLGFCLLLVV